MSSELLLLFTSSFLASTLLPGGSELALIAIASDSSHSKWILLIVSTIGNTLGGVTSWFIGLYLARKYQLATKLKQKHHKAVEYIRKHGAPMLLFSWVPIIGDPLCLAAGWLKINFIKSVSYAAAGKMSRYGLILIAL